MERKLHGVPFINYMDAMGITLIIIVEKIWEVNTQRCVHVCTYIYTKLIDAFPGIWNMHVTILSKLGLKKEEFAMNLFSTKFTYIVSCAQ